MSMIRLHSVIPDCTGDFCPLQVCVRDFDHLEMFASEFWRISQHLRDYPYGDDLSLKEICMRK